MTRDLPTRVVVCFWLFLFSGVLVACGGGATPTSSPTAPPTASAVSTPAAPATSSLTSSAAATATAVAAAPPPGGPAPSQLIGTWTRVVTTANSGVVLTLTADRFRVVHARGGPNGTGEIVVNGDEIDFFNTPPCGLVLPAGVGHYQWSMKGTTLHFTPLNTDPCGDRGDHFANQDFTKTGG